ncbi:MAG: hypothetical protein PHF37_03220 [Phycisphaerae bacterium]|jgi:hypothetical protein|nr:hypothetical protein [Phycisphaerae bacterium]
MIVKVICPDCGTLQEINFVSNENAAYRCPMCSCLYQPLAQQVSDTDTARILTVKMIKQGNLSKKR